MALDCPPDQGTLALKYESKEVLEAVERNGDRKYSNMDLVTRFVIQKKHPFMFPPVMRDSYVQSIHLTRADMNSMALNDISADRALRGGYDWYCILMTILMS